MNVVDVNDNFPVFVTSIPESLPIYEHPYSANGELVIQLNATDADSGKDFLIRFLCSQMDSLSFLIGEFGLVRYLFASNNVEGEDEFAIDLVTGAMTIKDSALLDFEKKRTYRFAVQARDNYRPNILSKNFGQSRKRWSLTCSFLDDRWEQLGGSSPQHHVRVSVEISKVGPNFDLWDF